MFSALRKQLVRLSIRLTAWHALFFFSVVFAVIGLTYLAIKERLLDIQRDAVQFRMDKYAAAYREGGFPRVRAVAEQHEARERRATFISVVDAANRVVYQYDAGNWAGVSFRPPSRQGSAESRGWLTERFPDGTNLLLEFHRFSDGFVLYVGRSTELMQETLRLFRNTAFLLLLVFLPVSIVCGAVLTSRVLHPIEQLKTVVEGIVDTASFEARVPSRGTSHELDALVEMFNRMLTRIDQLVRGMRDSLDHVAHDLRTPITRLRQKAFSALESAAGLDAARDALAECVEESERVITLLNTIMDIAETEAGLVKFRRDRLEVGELARSAMDVYAEVAEEKGVSLDLEIEPGIFLLGDVAVLRRVFANLLDNAIKFTPAGGKVALAAERAGRFVAVKVADTGYGIPDDELPRIWDRLYRGDKSRSSPGFGLGLSFVRAAVESHGGRVDAVNRPEGGAIVTVFLPLAEDATRPTYDGVGMARNSITRQ